MRWENAARGGERQGRGRLTIGSEHVIALAELELVRGLLQLLGRDETPPRQHLLERREPDGVIHERPDMPFRVRNPPDERLPELFPLIAALLVEGYRHAEHAALPGLVEDELTVPPRKAGSPLHGGDHLVHAERAAVGRDARRRSRTRAAIVSRSPSRTVVVDGLAVGARLPGGCGELILGELRWWRQTRVGVQHPIDVIVHGDCQRVRVDRVEPLRLAVEEEKCDVGERARPEAAADGEVDQVAQAASLPFAMKRLGRHRREPVLRPAAATAARADEQMPPRAGNVHSPAVGAHDEVAAALVVHGKVERDVGACTYATPIKASRVINGTRSASPSFSVPAGRSGSTMYLNSALLSHTRTSRSCGMSTPNSFRIVRGSLTARERYAGILYHVGGSPSTGHG